MNQSLIEAERSLQAGADIASCVMLGRSLEALCDVLEEQAEKPTDGTAVKPKRRLMLGNGIKELRERKIIDDRLYDWSLSLQAMRNLAAHPEDINVSRQDAEDLQAFVYPACVGTTVSRAAWTRRQSSPSNEGIEECP